ncbi:MAG: histidine phosphatase family protein [bacterium]
MALNTTQYGMKTLEIVRQLRKRGVEKISVLMRHSARHYDEEHLERESLMWLTEEGKQYAHAFGQNIPPTPLARFFSSMLGRCIETAYQADKGYTSQGGKTESNMVMVEIAPFFVKNPPEVFKLHRALGTSQLFREWFAGNLSSELVGRSDKIASEMISRLTHLLQEGPASHIDFNVSHDWNLTMVKHHFLKLEHEKAIAVEYLEGIVIFEKDDAFYITSHETSPLKLDPIPPGA